MATYSLTSAAHIVTSTTAAMSLPGLTRFSDAGYWTVITRGSGVYVTRRNGSPVTFPMTRAEAFDFALQLLPSAT